MNTTSFSTPGATLPTASRTKPFAPLTKRDLHPLRQRTLIQTEIQQQVQRLLAEGVDQRCETMMRALGLVFDHALPQLAQGLTSGARQRLDDDLQHLAADLLMSYFPRQEDGRFPLGATILLDTYETDLLQSQGRQVWLVACAPSRRRDPQVVTLSLASLIGVNHAHCWDQARWLWDERYRLASEEERWDVSGLDLDQLGLDQREDHLALFANRCAQPTPSLANRVSCCLVLQDAGRIQEAFSFFAVELTPDVLLILSGWTVIDGPSGGCYRSEERWATPLLHALRHAAPWRFASVLATGKRFRLFCFPHQPQQRKASLMLTWSHKPKKTPALEIEWTASNKRLAETTWMRPLDLDLRRFHRCIEEGSSTAKTTEPRW